MSIVVATPQRFEAAEQKQLAADLIQLIEVRIPIRSVDRIGSVVHAQSMPLAKTCGIPKVFFADSLDQFVGVAYAAGLRVEVVLTVRH